MTTPREQPSRARATITAVAARPVAGIAVAGAAWGLGLARFLGDAMLWTIFYASPTLAGALGLTAASLAVVLWRWCRAARSTKGSPCWFGFAPLLLPIPYVLGVTSGPLSGAVLVGAGCLLTGLSIWRTRPNWLPPALLIASTFLLYLQTLLPSVGEADTFEFQVVVPRLGVAHPTGYPLYVLLARLFTILPLNNVAWRVNLSSAVFAVAAVVVLYYVVRELIRTPSSSDAGATATDSPKQSLGVRDLFPLLSALSFACSATFWSQAIVAEVYTLHNLLTATILLLLLRRPSDGTGRSGAPGRTWYLVSFLVGLSLTNHLTTALFLPAAILALRFDQPRFRIRTWLNIVGLFLLGLSVYIFIPLRWPAVNHGERMAVADWLRYISGGQFHGALRLNGWRDPVRWRIVGRLLQQPFGWPGIALAAAGVLRLARRRRRALALTGLTFLAFLAYGLSYYVADIAVFLLPAHLILAIWMGVGAACLVELLRAFTPKIGGVWPTTVLVLFALIPLSLIWRNLPALDRSQEQGGYDWGQYALSRPLKQGSAILADTKKFAPLYYLQQVEGLRPDLDLLLLGTEEQYQAELVRRLEGGDTVYLARYLPNLGGLYLQSVGPLAEIRTGPPTAGTGSLEPQARFRQEIALLAAEIEPDPLGRAIHHLTLHWRPDAPIDQDLVVRVRLAQADGPVHWTSDGTRPVNGLYPTNAWSVGVPVTDYHEIAIPSWLPTGPYRLEVGLFVPFGDEGLDTDAFSPSWASIGMVEVKQTLDAQPLPGVRRLAFGGDTWLVGFDVPSEVTAGSAFPIYLSWRRVAEEIGIEVAWERDGMGEVEVGIDSLPAGTIRSRHVLTAPLATGSYRLNVGQQGNRIRCSWLGLPQESCRLAELRVRTATEEMVDFGGRVLLTEAQVDAREVAAGELIPVLLVWRGLRVMDVDYTVFVHLVGPNGQLWGQVDSWPLQGSFPTSQWTPGDRVRDSYEVPLPSDAPAGRYRVEVGFYELGTMERLKVLDADGTPIGDSYIVDQFEVRP